MHACTFIWLPIVGFLWVCVLLDFVSCLWWFVLGLVVGVFDLVWMVIVFLLGWGT